jgi:hypothetical protein
MKTKTDSVTSQIFFVHVCLYMHIDARYIIIQYIANNIRVFCSWIFCYYAMKYKICMIVRCNMILLFYIHKIIHIVEDVENIIACNNVILI